MVVYKDVLFFLGPVTLSLSFDIIGGFWVRVGLFVSF